MIKAALSLVVAVILSLNAQATISASSASQLLSGILTKMDSARRNLKSLKATLTQKQTNIQIGTVDTDQGTLIYKPKGDGKGMLRIDYSQPDVRVVSIIGEDFVFYQPRINQILKTKLAKAAQGGTGSYVKLIALDSSVKSLMKEYRIEYVNDETIGGQPAAHLCLTPLKGNSLISIDLYVNQQNWLPVQYKFTDRNGDYSVVNLNHLQINLNLTDDSFIVRYPSGTAVVSRLDD